VYLKCGTQWQTIWRDIQIPTDDKIIRFRDSLYRKLNKNFERLRKPDTNHRKQHTMQHQHYVELYTQTQKVTPINFSKKKLNLDT
jgi:hypothetical protein